MNSLKKNYKNYLFSSFTKNYRIYSFIVKNKYRRDSQPGLTRYNWDQMSYNKESYEQSRITHCTNAEELISKVPVVEVQDDVVLCYGVAEMGWGHPIEYIKLNTRDITKPSICKYCGLRYVMKSHH